MINEYFADMESFCRKNELTMTLVKKEPIDECDDHILEEKSKTNKTLKMNIANVMNLAKIIQYTMNMKIMNKMKSMKTMYVVMNLTMNLNAGIRNCMGSEEKTSKEIETNSTEVKMITKTRGLKVEEKLKESYVYSSIVLIII